MSDNATRRTRALREELEQMLRTLDEMERQRNDARHTAEWWKRLTLEERKRAENLKAIVDELEPEVLQAAREKAARRGALKRLQEPEDLKGPRFVSPLPSSQRATGAAVGAILGGLAGYLLSGKPKKPKGK